MSFNMSMHPRNPYKSDPPDFKALAIKYPELRKYCTLGNNGKIHLNFFEDKAIRLLTIAMFHNDFGLNVNLPIGCLVPRIPQKMNYLLLVEDILLMNDMCNDVNGIDIGTGASSVYSLLGAKRFGWSFIGTDIETSSIEVANENVKNNSLEKQIKVLQVSKNTIFQEIFDKYPEKQFSFSLCNPPFFEQDEAAQRFPVQISSEHLSNLPDAGSARSDSRSLPRSSTVARLNELEVEGGEETFVLQMIEDSITFASRIKIFSSMLGKKSSLKIILGRLNQLVGVKHKVNTLCQGRTQRWVIVWTFCEKIRLEKIISQLKISSVHICQGDITRNVQRELDKLEIKYEATDEFKFICEAAACTWLNLRRKRRLKSHQNQMNQSGNSRKIMCTSRKNPSRDIGGENSHREVKTVLLKFSLLFLNERTVEFELLVGSNDNFNQLLTCLRSRISK